MLKFLHYLPKIELERWLLKKSNTFDKLVKITFKFLSFATEIIYEFYCQFKDK